MEDKKKFKELDEKQNSKEKIKQIFITKQYINDLETEDNSLQLKSKLTISDTHLFNENKIKKSNLFLKKKIYLEKPEEEENNCIIKKKNHSMEENLQLKSLVPHLKPMEMHLVPSKLCLNKRSSNIVGNNQDNNYMSCPNSEGESDAFISSASSSSNKSENLKNTRKSLQRTKNVNFPKILSKKELNNKSKTFFGELNSDNEFLENNDFDNDKFFLYDENDLLNDNKEKEDEKNGIKEEHPIRNNRINSCSILDVLKNKLSFDETN